MLKPKLDKEKIALVTAACWSQYEAPILIAQIEVKHKGKKKFKAGIVMVTIGTIYFFRNPLIGGVTFRCHLHFLDIRVLSVSPTSVSMEINDDDRIEIKTKEPIPLASAIIAVNSYATKGLPNYKPFQIESTVQMPASASPVTSLDSIKMRVICLAHFYDIKTEQMYTVDYLDKWLIHQRDYLVIGRSFHPGNLGVAIGHALGWETRLNTVAFQKFCSKNFPRLLESVLENSLTILRIAFVDYDETLPTFPNRKISKTIVKRYWFLRCSVKMLFSFIEFSNGLPEGMESLLIESTTLPLEIFSRLAETVPYSNCFRSLRSLRLVNIKFEKPIHEELRKLIVVLPQLKEFHMLSYEFNATDILTVLCKHTPKIRMISLCNCYFRAPINLQETIIPPDLINMNVSRSKFTNDSLISFFQFLTSTQVVIPIILEARHLRITNQSYAFLTQIDFSKVQPNISEIDWSINPIPNEFMNIFFSFLFLQKRLRLICFNQVEPEDPQQFLANTLKLVHALNLPGIELSGKFDPVMYSQFIAALISHGPNLQHVGVHESNSAEDGIRAFVQLLQGLPTISEVKIDGFKAKDQKLLRDFWKFIAFSKTIKYTDYPTKDLYVIQGDSPLISGELKDHLDLIKEKQACPNCYQRSQFISFKIDDIYRDSFNPEEVIPKQKTFSELNLFHEAQQGVHWANYEVSFEREGLVSEQ